MTKIALRVLRIVRQPLALCIVLLLLPLVVTLTWGRDGIGDRAYTSFYTADALAHAYDGSRLATLKQLRPASPLWIASLTAVAALNLPLSQLALILGALGWGLACVAVTAVGRELEAPATGSVAAMLLAFSPSIVAPTVMATEMPWLLCLAWVATWTTLRRRWRAQTLALALLLALHVTPATLALTVLLLWARVRAGASYPWALRLLLAGVLAVWVVLTSLGLVADPFDRVSIAAWLARVEALLAESDFYWLAVPFIIAGLASLWQRRRWRWALVLSALALLLSAPDTSDVLAYGVALFVAGIGAEAIAGRLVRCEVLTLSPGATRQVVGLVALSALTVAQAMSLAQTRPTASDRHQALVTQAAAWVTARTSADDRLLGTSRIGYLAGRSLSPFEGKARDTDALAALMAGLRDNPPAACVSYRSLAWDDLQHTGWFQDTYYEARAFYSDYDPLSPVKVWLRWPTTFDLGTAYEPLRVRLPDGAAWIGQSYGPDRIRPGEAVSVTLFVFTPLTAENASTDRAKPVTIYLQAPAEDASFAHSDALVDREQVLDDPETGTVWAETYRMETPGDLSIGAYYLSASLRREGSDDFARLYQGQTTFPIDRVTLGYVVVPWRGDLSGITPVGASLDVGGAGANGITLLGYETEGEATPGGTLDVRLYWEAQGDLGDVTTPHFVFVHVLDGNGQLITQHDGPPAAGTYPLAAWIPGEPVRDSHTLFLDPALPPGTYTLTAGVYTWPTFDRLPARDASGAPLQDNVIPLGTVTVR